MPIGFCRTPGTPQRWIIKVLDAIKSELEWGEWVARRVVKTKQQSFCCCVFRHAISLFFCFCLCFVCPFFQDLFASVCLLCAYVFRIISSGAQHVHIHSCGPYWLSEAERGGTQSGILCVQRIHDTYNGPICVIHAPGRGTMTNITARYGSSMTRAAHGGDAPARP